MDYAKLEHSEREIYAHDELECIGDVCPIHKRTDHSMRAFPQHWREDRYHMERICPHGVGHPDPDHLASLLVLTDDEAYVEAEAVHGCDGCCGLRAPVDPPAKEWKTDPIGPAVQEYRRRYEAVENAKGAAKALQAALSVDPPERVSEQFCQRCGVIRATHEPGIPCPSASSTAAEHKWVERVSEASALRSAFVAGVEVGVAYADKHPSDTHTMPSVKWCHARYEKWAARRALEDTKDEPDYRAVDEFTALREMEDND